MIIGPIAILVVIFVIGPIALFLVGGGWSAIHGWIESDAADRRERGGAPSPEELT